MRTDARLNLVSALVNTTSTRVGRVFAIVLASAVLQVVGQTALARTLSKDDVGIVSLLMGALPLLSALSLLGQDSSSVRFLTRSDASEFDARRHLRNVLLFVLPLGVVVALVAVRFYSLAGLAAAAAIALVVSQNTVTMTTSALRARHRYELAMTGARTPVMVTAVGLALVALAGALTLDRALWIVILGYIGTAAIFAVHAARVVPAGVRRVPRSVIQNGFFFLGISVSLSVMVAMDKLVIGRMLPMSELAVYATIFSVMRGFDFIFYSLSYVLLPRVNVLGSIPMKRLNLAIAAIAVVVTILYLTLGRQVVHLLFVGRYDAGFYLIAPFALSGVLKLFYSVPSSVIGARLPRKALREFLVFNLAGIGLNVALDIVLIASMGLLGAALATAISWAIRLLGGYMVLARHAAHAGPRDEIGEVA